MSGKTSEQINFGISVAEKKNNNKMDKTKQ